MAAVAEMANWPSPGHEQDFKWVEGVEQSELRLHAREIAQWLAGKGATRWRALSGDGSDAACCFVWLERGEWT